MERIKFLYQESSLVSKAHITAASAKVQNAIKQVKAAIGTGYDSHYASINLPADTAMHELVRALVKEKKALRPTMLVIIGIGGSSLGTKAVHEALLGTRYNEQSPPIRVYYADTIDTDYIFDLVLLVEQELEKNHEILINVVSKSGTTTETIANFGLFLHLLEKARKSSYQKYVVVTTDKGSKLWELAHEKGFSCLAIPAKVGGRYSVLSPVSLFPLELIGIDTQALRAGAQSMIAPCTSEDVFNNPAALRAIILAYWHEKYVRIHDMFLFSTDLQSVGAWYRQLLAESIGKNFDRHGNNVHVGITPTVSVGTTDLHSVAQLYLGGPYDKYSTFVSVAKHKSNIALPELPGFEKLVPSLQKKSLPKIMNAILQGVQRAYQKSERPFSSIVLPEKSAYYIGQLLQLHLLEVIYLGDLLDVNPFDQPHVELYKQETKEILAHE